MLRGMRKELPESSLMMWIKQAIEEIIEDENIAMRVSEGSNETKTVLKIINADDNTSVIVTIEDFSALFLGW